MNSFRKTQKKEWDMDLMEAKKSKSILGLQMLIGINC